MLNKPTWPLFTLAKKRNVINTNPDYQRPSVWTKAQKQLLIDTILREYDIPKIYLHKKQDETYDVIDGQQRIRTIWAFYDDEFALAKDAEPVNGIEVAGKRYSELDMDTASIIDGYNLDFVVLDNEDEDEIREMFLRLQNGTTLKAQEKRNAMPGKMRDFVKNVSSHEFFKKVSFNNSRFTFDLIAAQICLLNNKGTLCNIKDKDLNNLYESNHDFDPSSQEAKNLYKILDYMNRMFPEKCPELKRYNVVSLFALLMDMLPNYVMQEREQDIANWFVDFETKRALDEEKSPEEQDPVLVLYHERVSHSTDTYDSLKFRHDILKESLLSSVHNLPQKDDKRSFDESQRQVIYRRDNRTCKMCGKVCEWNDWEADHVIPWIKGGRTEIENGQVLCPSCNSKKGGREL